jgi:hypothetical protein
VAPVPAHAALGDAPSVATWMNEAARWAPPACLPWPAAQYRLIVALAGSFPHAGDAATLLARFGAISAKKGLRYWSVSDKRWTVLVEDAAALAGGRRRADFAPAEMQPGVPLAYEEADNRSAAPVSYRMRVLDSGAGRIVIETRNESPVRAFLVTLFPPGSLRAAAEESYVNRAIALYRHYTGQKT